MCGVGTLINDSEHGAQIKAAGCRSWLCEWCAPGRARSCEIEARRGRPNRFLTLTCTPDVGMSALDRRRIMGEAWPVFVKRIKRYLNNGTFEYWAVCEKTQLGEPHFHVLIRSKFLPQKLLSQWWKELTGAYVVWIVEVKKSERAASYVSKYLTKGLERFGTYKRYWKSKNYVLPETEKAEETWERKVWRYVKEHVDDVVFARTREGWQRVPHQGAGRVWVLLKPPWWAQPPRGPPQAAASGSAPGQGL
jgi:hypothetical protein